MKCKGPRDWRCLVDVFSHLRAISRACSDHHRVALSSISLLGPDARLQTPHPDVKPCATSAGSTAPLHFGEHGDHCCRGRGRLHTCRRCGSSGAICTAYVSPASCSTSNMGRTRMTTCRRTERCSPSGIRHGMQDGGTPRHGFAEVRCSRGQPGGSSEPAHGSAAP